MHCVKVTEIVTDRHILILYFQYPSLRNSFDRDVLKCSFSGSYNIDIDAIFCPSARNAQSQLKKVIYKKASYLTCKITSVNRKCIYVYYSIKYQL